MTCNRAEWIAQKMKLLLGGGALEALDPITRGLEDSFVEEILELDAGLFTNGSSKMA